MRQKDFLILLTSFLLYNLFIDDKQQITLNGIAFLLSCAASIILIAIDVSQMLPWLIKLVNS